MALKNDYIIDFGDFEGVENNKYFDENEEIEKLKKRNQEIEKILQEVIENKSVKWQNCNIFSSIFIHDETKIMLGFVSYSIYKFRVNAFFDRIQIRSELDKKNKKNELFLDCFCRERKDLDIFPFYFEESINFDKMFIHNSDKKSFSAKNFLIACKRVEKNYSIEDFKQKLDELVEVLKLKVLKSYYTEFLQIKQFGIFGSKLENLVYLNSALNSGGFNFDVINDTKKIDSVKLINIGNLDQNTIEKIKNID